MYLHEAIELAKVNSKNVLYNPTVEHPKLLHLHNMDTGFFLSSDADNGSSHHWTPTIQDIMNPSWEIIGVSSKNEKTDIYEDLEKRISDLETQIKTLNEAIVGIFRDNIAGLQIRRNAVDTMIHPYIFK